MVASLCKKCVTGISNGHRINETTIKCANTNSEFIHGLHYKFHEQMSSERSQWSTGN